MRPRWHIFGNSEVVLDPVCQSRSSCLSSKTLELPTSKEAWLSNDRLLLEEVANTRSNKRRFAFQTFTETPTTTPSTLGFGISHQPHEGGGWCEMWCEIRWHTFRHFCGGYSACGKSATSARSRGLPVAILLVRRSSTEINGTSTLPIFTKTRFL